MHYDIIIVGANFAGLTLAHHLPKNLRVLILDKKKHLDSCIESTGLITQQTKNLIGDFFDVDRFIPNKINSLCVVSTNFEDHFFSKTKDPWIYSTDTPRLIKSMAENLPDNVDIEIGSIFMSQEDGKVSYFQNGREKIVRCKFIVGADGAQSSVAKSNFNLSQNKKFLIGLEKVFYGDILLGNNPEQSVYHFWFGEFSLGYGGWLSPTIINGRKAFRVGLAKLEKDAPRLNIINEFIQILIKKKIIRIEEEVVTFGSHIPIGGPLKKIHDERCLLIGDAAGLCGAFAADGIKGAIVSGKVAAKLIPQYLNGDSEALKKFYPEIQKHNRLMSYYKRQLLYRFLWDRIKTNKSFDLLYQLVKREKENFLNHFCDSKDNHKSLGGSLIKARNAFLLAKYGLSLLPNSRPGTDLRHAPAPGRITRTS